MSGSIGLGSLVLSLFTSSAPSASDSLLAALYPAPGSTTASGDPIAALKNAEANSTTDIASTAAQSSVAQDIATFRSKVASATSAASLLQDPTVLKVLLTANGLGDQAQYPVLAQKALLSNTTDSTSLADTLSNTSWKATASLFDFANKGLSVVQTSSVIDTIANGYAEVLWRKSLDATTPGLSEALTFRAAASTITSADQILGDATLRSVVTTALGIPLQIAFQDIGAQEQAITSQLDITKFKDPKFVESFAAQYLLAAGQAASSSTSTSSLDQLAASSQGLIV
jgi:hypothetical protein